MMRRALRQRPTWHWLILIILVAVALRLPYSGTPSLWFDEAVSYLTASLPLRDILGNVVKDPHPPFYYLLLHGWLALVPDGDAWFRLLGTGCDLLLIPTVYGLGRRLLPGRRPALVAAAFVAISPFHVFYAHELRMYSLLMLLTSLAALLYLRARQSEEPRPQTGTSSPETRRTQWARWAAFTVVALLAIYTHLFTIFVLVAIGLHALIHRRDKRALRRTVVAGLVLGLLFLPWLGVLAGESQYDLGSLRPLAQARPGELTALKLITVPTFLLFGFSDRLWYSGLALFLSLATIMFLLMDVRRSRESRGFGRLLLPALIVTCVIGIPVAVHAVRPFFLPERTMAPAVPFTFLGLAWATTRRDTPLPYLVAAVAAAMGLGTVLYLADGPQKPPYREAIRFVAERQEPGDVILHTSDGSYLPSLRYATLSHHYLLEGDPDPRKPRAVYAALGGAVRTLQEATGARECLWLIVALEHSIEWQEEQVRVMAQRYRQEDSFRFGNVDVLLYQLSGPPGQTCSTKDPSPTD
jgi:uncharacterized membrane protein